VLALAWAGGADRAPAPAVPRHVAGDPALTPGVVSTPGGALEWQYAAVGLDRVPGAVLRQARAITIGVVDTGADLGAPDLAAKRASAYDVSTGRRRTTDADGHGTFVASLAAGSASNGVGMAGFGGDARLLVVQAAPSAGGLTDVDVAAGLVYAVEHGARIVNLSVAGTRPSAVERAALEIAVARGALVVVAAGNDFQHGNPRQYPASYAPGLTRGRGAVLVVAASDMAGRRASFSSTGPYVSVAAPGETVLGAVAADAPAARYPRVAVPDAAGGSYAFASGTSYAAPQVAGVAALVWGANRSLSARQVATILERTASGHGTRTDELGYGVVDAAAAVDVALRSR
jgi:subtilisin family serine protease